MSETERPAGPAMTMREIREALGHNVSAPAVDYRLALSEALGLGTGAPWDAILDRVRELHTAANGSGLQERPCHEATRDQKIHGVHVYRFQGRESFWCPGLAEPHDPGPEGS